MKKKILLGIILADAILIGVSLTSVVGYRNVESNVNTSPLFFIRNRRAIGKGENSLTATYVGFDKEINLFVPPIDKKVELTERILHNIHNMDDASFDRFVHLIKSHINHYTINEKEIKFALHFQRNNQGLNDTMSLLSWNEPCTIGVWLPGCFIINILSKIVDYIYAFIAWINNIRHSISYIIPGCCETWN
jgi:hypothetical protein